MNNKMRELTTILLNGDKLSDGIYSDIEKINSVGEKYNTLLDIKSNSVDALKTTHISETVIAPRVFTAVNHKEKYDFVVIGLTPKYNPKKVHLEKQSAGDTWENYFKFYTSDNFFKYAGSEYFSAYTNTIKLLFSLYEDHEAGKISVEAIEKTLETNKNDLLNVLLKERSVLFPEMVPFHSQGFGTNLNGINHLRENLSAYDQYINELFAFIKEYTSNDGIIISNGFSNSRIVRSIIEKDGATLLMDNHILSVQEWDSKLAVLFNDQLFTRHGLRSDEEIDAVMTKIRAIMNNRDKQSELLDDLQIIIEKLLNKRISEDHIERGRRIKGSKVKGFAVKKLRQ